MTGIPVFPCEICQKTFNVKKSLKVHQQRFHDIPFEKERRGPKPVNGYKFNCDACGIGYSAKRRILEHYATCPVSPIEIPEKKLIKRKTALPCPVSGCSHESSNREKLIGHLQLSHANSIPPIKKALHLRFTSFEEFFQWKQEEENRTKTRYVKHHGAHPATGGSVRTAYLCHRSGAYVAKGFSKRRLKAQGSCKMGTVCPAYIAVIQRPTGILDVTFRCSHIGHDNEVALFNWNKKDLRQQLALEIPFEKVLDNTRDGLHAGPVSRLHLVEQFDAAEARIGRDFGLEDPDVHYINDAIESVATLISSLDCIDGEDNCVRFVKFQNQGSPYDGLVEQDFMLVLMTEVQTMMLREFGPEHVVCIDSTLGINPYGLQLISVLIVDESGEAVPVAFCFSNVVHTEALECFLCVVRETVGFPIQDVTLMTDDEESYETAWTAVMGAPAHQLLSTWHVDRAWRDNLHSKVDEDSVFKGHLYKGVRALMETQDMSRFKDLIRKFIHFRDDPKRKPFASYFADCYAERPESWAYCHRMGGEGASVCTVENSVHLEALHYLVKHVYFKGLAVCRLDRAVHALMYMLRTKCINHLSRLHVGKANTFVLGIRRRHALSVTMKTDVVRTVMNVERWELRDGGTDVYVVQKEAGPLPHADPLCMLKCEQCHICIHSYSCTCVDFCLHATMCKHIHLVARAQLASNARLQNVDLGSGKKAPVCLLVINSQGTETTNLNEFCKAAEDLKGTVSKLNHTTSKAVIDMATKQLLILQGTVAAMEKSPHIEPKPGRRTNQILPLSYTQMNQDDIMSTEKKSRRSNCSARGQTSKLDLSSVRKKESHVQIKREPGLRGRKRKHGSSLNNKHVNKAEPAVTLSQINICSDAMSMDPTLVCKVEINADCNYSAVYDHDYLLD